MAGVDVGTELRLGLPGGDGAAVKATAAAAGKRGFEEITTIDLKLKLPTAGMEEAAAGEAEVDGDKGKRQAEVAVNDPEKPPAPKAQVVGWPPVRSYRKNIMTVQSVKSSKKEEDSARDKQLTANSSNGGSGGGSSAFVKVSMDGAPYLRKVDLKMYRSYQELSLALQSMFGNFTTTGNNMNEGKVIDLVNGSEFVPTYEDKDDDWMLVGDVPWEMFVDSCKRLRIMKGSDAIGLAPRGKEKGTNKS